MAAQDIYRWFVTLVGVIAMVSAVALPIVVLMTRKSRQAKQADPGMLEYGPVPDVGTHASDHGHDGDGD